MGATKPFIGYRKPGGMKLPRAKLTLATKPIPTIKPTKKQPKPLK